jgi:DNA polymerase sigma
VRPLTLLLKCILKQRGLSEVYMGGLGSWSLVNMVIAHLMVRITGMCLLLLDHTAGEGAALVVCGRQLAGRWPAYVVMRVLLCGSLTN